MIEFQLLGNRDFKGRCSEMLPNKMQCYNGSDFALIDSEAKPDSPKRQVCRFHARLIYDAQQKEAVIVAAPAAQPEQENEKPETKTEPTQTKTQKDTVNVIPTKPTSTESSKS